MQNLVQANIYVNLINKEKANKDLSSEWTLGKVHERLALYSGREGTKDCCSIGDSWEALVTELFRERDSAAESVSVMRAVANRTDAPQKAASFSINARASHT